VDGVARGAGTSVDQDTDLFVGFPYGRVKD
jgi:hypothetical protein